MMMMTMMDILKEQPLELEIGSSKESLLKVLESQKLLIHRQIDQFQSVVNTQCKLTGVNPLAQEMAAGALSIKIGKRPRDMLIPKALKYMQSVFSIKDAISKKETREISALFGVTVTQVREYFANQRSRVRKLARLSREKAIIREHTSKESQEHMLNDSDLMQPIDPVPLSTVGPSSADEAPSCSNQGEVLPGLGESEKQFVENIFSSMCKEETFSGQVKLMEWILRIENSSILCWFLTKGGVMILATWLSQAASEEQTTVLSVALKVLSHLPLHKAIPAHMSVIIQAVNKLRFYRISDISIRAKVLLSKWSKMLSKSLASRKPNGVKSAGVQEIDLSQRIGELIGDDSWQPSIDNPDGALVPSYLGTDDIRKMESRQAVKLLTAADDSNKKNILGSSAIQNKERRKVLLVEQPGQKAAAKSQPVRAVAVGQARPITADEIQKAKVRAQLMQSGKLKPEGPKKPSLLTNDFLSASEAYLRPKLEAQKKARVLPPKNSTQVDSLADEKRPLSPKESLLDKCRRVRISWRTPPEIKLDESWSIGTGESSKEIEVQKNRMRREKETIYQTLEEVPPNPKDPWDIEMDYDDSLTPEVPLEQVPDGDSQMADLTSSQNPSAISPGPPSQSGSGAEPDLELLAVLLKNPELVFALAKGEAGLSSEDTVRLLDMLKSNGQPGMLNGTVEKVEVSLPSPTPVRNVEVSLPSPTPPSRVEVSLPSPTPSSNPGPSGWATTQTTTKNPFSRLSTAAFNGVQSTVIASDRLQFPAAVAPTLPSLSQQLSSRAPMADPQASSSLLETHPTFFNPASAQIPQSVNHQPPLNSSYSISYSHPHLHDPYEVPENSSHNRAMLNSARQGSVPNSIHARVDQNGYDPVALPGTSRERNEYYPTARTGYESWSPEDSPSRYQPEHRLQVQQGWRYQDQRGRGYGPPPPDRNISYQNLGGVRDNNWYGGGRRWQDGDRRR